MSGQQEIRVPDIGDFEEVEVVEIMVAKGDRVALEDPVVCIESDKATLEVPTPVAGRVGAILVSLGDRVSEGTPLLVIASEGIPDSPAEGAREEGAREEGAREEGAREEGAREEGAPISEGAAPESESDAQRSQAPPPQDFVHSVPREKASGGPHAGPGARRYARELGVDLAGAEGSGRRGRILREDITRHVREQMSAGPRRGQESVALPPVPIVDASRFGPVREEALSRIRRASARNLSRSWLNVPHVTQHDDADVTLLEAFRRSCRERARDGNLKLSPLHFILKSVAFVLRDFPDFRSSLSPTGDALVVKDYFHLGVAVDTDAGLVVPVLRDVDRKGIFELAEELAELSQRARARRLEPADMQGACFTVSSLGGIGGRKFTPIVNAPEVAILGLSKLRVEPRWTGGMDPVAGGEFEARVMLPLSLSYDHRVIDGAAAARFTTRLSRVLAEPAHLLL